MWVSFRFACWREGCSYNLVSMFLEDGYHRIFLCRDSILLITLLLSGCLCLSQLAFYGEQRTWNEAYSICVQHGGLLVSVNSSEMYDMMGGFSKGSPWKTATGINEPVWIGIHATDSQGQSLEWADCVPTTWTQWHPSEPKSPDIYQCAYLKSFTTNMWMDICSETKNFICENIDSGACSSPSVSCYEATLGQTGTVVSSNTDSRPTSPCVNFTDTNTTLDPSDQISSTNSQYQSSEITTNNASPAESHTLSPETTTSQSVMMSQSLSTSQSVMTSQPLSTPQSVMTSQSLSTSQSVMTSQRLSTSQLVMTSQPLPTSQSVMTSQSLSSPQSVTTTKPQSTSLSTETYTESQTDCEISATASSTKTTNCVTSSTAYTSTVGECLCTCTDDGVNLTMAILQSRIETRKKLLTVNKSSLSSTIRKKESANDSRPSAKGIGAVGVLFIVFVFGGIVFMDLHSLYLFISKHYRRKKRLAKKEHSNEIVHCYSQNVKIKLKKTTHT